MLEKAKEVTRNGQYNNLEYARFADDMVVLVDGHPQQAKLLGQVYRRLIEELTKLEVEVNTDKTRVVDLTKDESFSFLGFDFKRVRDNAGKWYPHKTPRNKKRTELLEKLKQEFRRLQTQALDVVIYVINPIIRGWVNYYRIGNSSRCFNYIRYWVEKKVRRHLMKVRKRKGYGWKRWSKEMLYEECGLWIPGYPGKNSQG